MNLLKKYYSMSTLEKLDKVDLQILRTLQENARLTTKELGWRYGYVFAWTLMLILVAVIYFYFKRKKWY